MTSAIRMGYPLEGGRIQQVPRKSLVGCARAAQAARGAVVVVVGWRASVCVCVCLRLFTTLDDVGVVHTAPGVSYYTMFVICYSHRKHAIRTGSP